MALRLGLCRSNTALDHARARQRIHRASQRLSRVLDRLSIVKIEIRHPGRLQTRQPTLLVANHPSLVDIMAILAHVEDADCIVNAARAQDLIFSGAIRAANYIRNDNASSVIRNAGKSLEAGRSVIIFPEGTRSPPGGLGPFRRGAAHIALTSRCPITPIFITVDPPGLTKNRRWWHIPRQTMHMTLKVGQPLPPVAPERQVGIRRAVAASDLTDELRVLFRRELENERTSRAGP